MMVVYQCHHLVIALEGYYLELIRIKSSKTEMLHLFVATLLVTGVGLSFNHYRHIS